MSGGGKVNFQTPTAEYLALAGQGGGGLFGAAPFPQTTANYGYGGYSPYITALNSIQNLIPNNVWMGNSAAGPNPFDTQNQTANLASTGASLLPQLQNILGLGNTASQGGQQIFKQLQGLIGPAASSGQGINAAGQDVYGKGQDIYNKFAPSIGTALNAGFDPQNQLYNKLFQQQEDQANAENAMAGVATTPYGAGLVQQGNQNFNLAWQQDQLARQQQAAQTAGVLSNSALGGLGAGLGGLQTGLSGLQSGYGLAGQLGQGAEGALGTGANALSSGYGAAGNLLGAAGGAIGAPANLAQQQIQDYLAYIGANTANSAALTGATNAATNAGANSTNALANASAANNAGKGGLGGALGDIGGLIGKFASGGFG